MKTCLICKEELKKFEWDFWTNDLWLCPTRHYSYEVLNQINESCCEYEEQIIFDSCILTMKQPYDVWEIKYNEKKWIHATTGEKVVTWDIIPIDPFALFPYNLEEIKTKLETYIIFA